jgi:hypothetical protein
MARCLHSRQWRRLEPRGATVRARGRRGAGRVRGKRVRQGLEHDFYRTRRGKEEPAAGMERPLVAMRPARSYGFQRGEALV